MIKPAALTGFLMAIPPFFAPAPPEVKSTAVTRYRHPSELVIGSGGPGFGSPEEAIRVPSEIVLPSFDQLIRLEKKKILAGGLPIGDRAFVFIAEASSNEELDQMFRELPMWGSLDW